MGDKGLRVSLRKNVEFKTVFLVERRHAVRFAILAALAPVIVAGTAGAEDKIYWADEQEHTIRVAPLADPIDDASVLGGPGAIVGGLPCGVTIDVRAEPDGKIYWADFGDGSSSGRIRVKNLDGSGDTTDLIFGEAGACGVAIDPIPTTRKLYWATFNGGAAHAGKIRVGTLSADGLSLTSADDLVTGETGPTGVAIDTTNRFIYWTNQASGEVRRADLDTLNQTDADVTIVALGEAVPLGLALDPATGPAGTLYWASYGSNAIRRTNLDSASSPETLLFPGFPDTPSGAVINPAGIAIDSDANRFYWANANGRTIWSANLSGDADVPGSLNATAVVDPVGVEPLHFPNFPALLRKPSGTAPPAISGEAIVGAELHCSDGTWAPDMLGSFLYRAPRSLAFQWKRESENVGADASSFTAGTPGIYSCEVTASNHAGSATQASDTITIGPTLSLRKYYDANANGMDDESGTITGWKVQVDGVGTYLTPKTVSLFAGSYVVRESTPTQSNWVATTPKVITQVLGAHDEATVKFGNVCVGAGGAKDSGFWKNKTGQATFTVPGDLTLLSGLNLRTEAGGNFNPTSFSGFATWVGKASGTNMAYALSAQLAVMALNVGHGMVDPTRRIQAPGTVSAQNSANNSFATIGSIMAEANAELATNSVVKGGHPARAHQAALQDALLKANTNKTFVQTAPCAFTFR